ncbi:MAG: DNA-directed RNA polymerase subunit L [Candidatus Hadarchaeota archaeon]
MQLELVEKGDKSRKIKIVGEDHTFCNLLRHELHQDRNVEAAAYAIEHPLTEHPKFFVKSEKSPEKAMLDAAERVSEQLDELRGQFQKAIKGK